MKAGDIVLTIVTAFIGIAILSVLVSKQSGTSGVIQALSSGLGNIIAAAVSPLRGGSAALLQTPTLN